MWGDELKEIWRNVADYDGEYQVSNTGKVKSLKSGCILRHSIINGYHRVSLYKNSKRKCYMVHRLVAGAFLDNSDDKKTQINHIDGNKSNNNVINLEWCTQTENLIHSFRIGLRKHNKERLIETNRKPVLQLDFNENIIKEWYSMSDASRALGLSVSNICNCCKGQIKSTGGYKWRKKSDY